jgi:hypothetical protein
MADESDEQEEAEAQRRIFQQDITPTLTDREEKKFFPWHKPRKHYIRVYQWCAEVRSLIKANGYQAGDVIRYLGFPGEDFLDIRTLQGVCAPENIVVRYLGFDSTSSHADQDFQFSLARHEVFQLGFIHEHSHVLRARIEQIVNDNSRTYHRTADYHDFDIINIDLCNSVATPANDEPQPPYFEAIKKLCDIQIAGRTRPWILFLATRAIRDQIESEAKWKLFDCVLRNVRESSEFAAKLLERLELDEKKIQQEMADKEQLAHNVLVSLFGLAIGKWLLKMMMGATPKLKVRLLKSYSYRVQIDEPDMLSLAFIFEPVTVPSADKSGLTKPMKAAEPPSEGELAVELISKVCEIVDIDQKLHDDDTLRTKMEDKCGDLLANCHYDKESYKKWVNKTRWGPS